MKGKVLITDYVHSKLKPGLEALGYDVTYIPKFNPQSLKDYIDNLEGIIINSKIKMTKEVINQAKQLRFIGRLGSGLEIIDQEAARERGIAVINSPEGNRNAVAEHALGMLLALKNNLIKADREVRSWQWNREANRGNEIDGTTIGIVGFGNTGQAFVKKLAGFDVQLKIYDPYIDPFPTQFKTFRVDSLAELANSADIISFHIPYNSETHHILDAKFIAQSKKGIIYINTSRGKIVHTQDLIDGLLSGHVGGVCLDVLENEKPETYSPEEQKVYNKLFSLPNIVVSPHVAGWTHQSLEKISNVLLEKIGRL